VEILALQVEARLQAPQREEEGSETSQEEEGRVLQEEDPLMVVWMGLHQEQEVEVSGEVKGVQRRGQEPELVFLFHVSERDIRSERDWRLLNLLSSG